MPTSDHKTAWELTQELRQVEKELRTVLPASTAHRELLHTQKRLQGALKERGVRG